jgi:hypothetical protein
MHGSLTYSTGKHEEGAAQEESQEGSKAEEGEEAGVLPFPRPATRAS